MRDYTRNVKSRYRRVLAALLALAIHLAYLDPPAFAEGELGDCRDVDFLHAFDEWAFGYAQPSNDREDYVSKWSEPVVIALRGEGAGLHDALVGQVAAELTAITGHPVQLGEGKVNVHIYISDNPLLSARVDPWFHENKDDQLGIELAHLAQLSFVFGKPFCAGTFSSEGGFFGSFAIEQDLLFIDTSYGEELLLSCLREELAHVLGGAGDLTAKDCTLFDDRELPADYTDLDKRMLATLYESWILPGMDRRRVLRGIARSIEEEESK